jgi:hypothetical protein
MLHLTCEKRQRTLLGPVLEETIGWAKDCYVVVNALDLNTREPGLGVLYCLIDSACKDVCCEPIALS